MRKVLEKQAIGRLGEDFVAAYLQKQGWRVAHRNWRCHYGELDIVAWHGETLVFVEVRTRRWGKAALQQALASIDHKKLSRLANLAAAFLEQEAIAPTISTRIDVFGVVVQKDGRFQLEHMRDVLQW